MTARRSARRRLGDWALRWIGPALFVTLWLTTDLGDARELFRNARPAPLIGAALLNMAIVLVKAWRWRVVMKAQAIDYAYPKALRSYTIACAFAAWTPGRLGDFTKAVSVSRDRKVSFGSACSSVIADRLLDAFVLTLCAAAGAELILGPVAGTITWCLVALAAVFGWVLYRWAGTAAPEKARAALGKVGLARAGAEMGDAIAGLETMVRPSGRRALIVSIPATLVATLLMFLQGWLVARSLDLNLSFLLLSSGLSAASIASLLPLSISGIGLREATLALFLGPSGVTLAQVLAFSVAYLLVVSGSAALFGAITHAVWPRPASERAPDLAPQLGGGRHA